MGLAFTGVGGALVFGRAWTVLDVAERAAIKSWGLLVPFREQPRQLDEFTRVTIGYEPGDSDSSEKFPVTLKARSGADFVVCSPTGYEESRACRGRGPQTHLGFALEDASGDHAVTLDLAAVNSPLQQRAAREAPPASMASRPAALRSDVHLETAGVRIVIPQPRTSPLGMVLVGAPIIIPLLIGPSLWRFFQQTHTPGPVGVAFLSMLVFLFGVLPAITMVNGFVRSRRGHTKIHASRQRHRARAPRLADVPWRRSPPATFSTWIGTRDSGAASARGRAEAGAGGHDAAC
jgi:hypothetical protein